MPTIALYNIPHDAMITPYRIATSLASGGITMRRTAIEHLVQWKDSPGRKPLVIRGARQVGKTYLVLEFGREHFANLVHINFERQSDLAALFSSKDPRKIIQFLELQLNVPIQPGRTLLFLDEIQAAGEVLGTLRYFYEEMPELHVIAAGSLLEFVLADHTFSMPVGRIEYLHLGPMTFEEYLAATGQERAVKYLASFSLGDTIPDPLHRSLIEQVRVFCAVGGMPAVVGAWLRDRAFGDSDAAKQSLLSTLEDDFGKYSKRVPRDRLVTVFRKIPLLVGQRFKYVNVSRDERAGSIRAALNLLCAARVGYPVCHTSCNGVPLRAEIREDVFKVLFLDVGLMTAACGLSLLDFENVEELVLVNQGAVCEQFVGQHLLHALPFYQPPELHYWVREKPTAAAEVDYVVAAGPDIVPIEVKAGKTGRLRSVQVFMDQKSSRLAVRFNSDLPSVVEAPIVDPAARRRSYRLVSLPLYLVGQFSRLVREALAAH